MDSTYLHEIYCILQACTHSGRQVPMAPKFFMMALKSSITTKASPVKDE
jgi:hypothetical protein